MGHGVSSVWSGLGLDGTGQPQIPRRSRQRQATRPHNAASRFVGPVRRSKPSSVVVAAFHPEFLPTTKSALPYTAMQILHVCLIDVRITELLYHVWCVVAQCGAANRWRPSLREENRSSPATITPAIPSPSPTALVPVLLAERRGLSRFFCPRVLGGCRRLVCSSCCTASDARLFSCSRPSDPS